MCHVATICEHRYPGSGLSRNFVATWFWVRREVPITDDKVSHLLPAYNEDRIVRVYAKKPELVSAHEASYFVFIIFISFRLLMKCLVIGWGGVRSLWESPDENVWWENSSA
jgi:hypothetical protein